MSRTYYWKLTQLSGSWTTGGNWINDPGGWSGRVPGPGDYAEVGSLTSPVTVTLSSWVGFRGLALGGTGGILPTVDIDGGKMYIEDDPFGRISDSWSTTSGQSFSGGGTISLRHNGSLNVGSTVAAGINVTFDGTSDILYLGGTTLMSPHPGLFSGHISGFGGSGEIVLSHVNYNVHDSFTYGGGVLSIFSQTHSNILNLSINLPAAGFALVPFASSRNNLNGKLTIVMVCFAAGTRILTGRGEVPVEALAEGDQVVTLEADARVPRPVRWLGRRRVNLAAHPDRESAAPIRIRAGAFGPSVPVRDLLLSPDHAVFVEGKLIPAKLLVNGGSIVQELSSAEVEYFHVELDRHAVLFAEGLTAESYLDTGNRAFFANAGLAMVLHPEFTVNAALRCWEDDACAPLTVNEAEVEPVWRRLAERAVALGHVLFHPATEAAAELVVEARGQIIRAVQVVGGRHIFALPVGLQSVRLVSRSASPSALRPWLEDRRRLGVKVSRLVLDGRTVAADDAMLAEGWWEVEADGRWTDGGGVLLLSGSPTVLDVQVATTLPAYPVETTERLAA